MRNSVELETLNFDREYAVDSNEYAEYIQGREIHTKYRGLQIRLRILVCYEHRTSPIKTDIHSKNVSAQSIRSFFRIDSGFEL